jgi:hypothetical protein
VQAQQQAQQQSTQKANIPQQVDNENAAIKGFNAATTAKNANIAKQNQIFGVVDRRSLIIAMQVKMPIAKDRSRTYAIKILRLIPMTCTPKLSIIQTEQRLRLMQLGLIAVRMHNVEQQEIHSVYLLVD